ncbi:MAG: RloB domain-containing protein [Oscillospiraceae bacterium]|nr:RloB domain-containing protein [Oscillospiraceae bacterium]
MPPIRTYTDWNKRPSDHEDQMEPFRKYVFICEGANTEVWYFRKLIDLRKRLGIHPLIDIRLWEKTEGDQDITYPRKLIEFAEARKADAELAFDQNHDRMIIVFDADIFSAKVTGYEDVVSLGEQYGDLLGITNPNFELYLLLHFTGAYEEDILPNAERLLRNEKVGNMRLSYSLLLTRTGINSKTNEAIGDLAEKVETAIEQEKHLNQDVHACLGQLTSNIGSLIEMIRADKPSVT